MLKGHNIICFSCDWQQDPLSKHHLMKRFAAFNRILWINSTGLRRPTLCGKDLVRAGNKLVSFFKSVQQVQENIFVISPLAIPFHSSSFMNVVNRILLTEQIRYYQNKLKFDHPIVWTFAPNVADILFNFGGKLHLYYITDDFTQFTGHPVKMIERQESVLIRRCNVLIASANYLAGKKAESGKHINVVTHGVEYHHFTTALSKIASDLPADMNGIAHPIIGFYGEINDWIDLKTMAEIARKRPDWSLVLLGRIAVEVGDISYLTDLPNVHWLGQKMFGALPDYCSAFDVALIPMKLDELTLSVNPLKLREYLAAGLPVVSAPLPEVLNYGDCVKFATTAEEYISQIEKWLNTKDDKLPAKLSRRVAGKTWDSKVEEISKIIELAF
jgi:glycosyltransferase involved in cell wall biosynthesis